MQRYKRNVFKRLMHVMLMKDQSLVRKLFVFCALLVVVPIGFIGFFTYENSVEVFENEARSNSWQIIRQVNTHIEYYVGDFEIEVLKILNNQTITHFLQMDSQEEFESSGMESNVKRILQNEAYSRSDITNITISLNNVATEDALDVRFNRFHPIESFQTELFQKILPNTGETVIVPRTLTDGENKEYVISIARRLFSQKTLKPIGFIVMDVNFKRFKEIASQVNIGHSGVMYIVDAQGNYVYNPSFSELGKKASLQGMREILQGESGSFVTSGKEKDLLTYSHSGFLGWTVITSIPYKELIKSSVYIRNTIFITTLLTLLAAAILGVGLASSIIKPVRGLQKTMKRVEKGDFSGQVKVLSKDEIGDLTNGFNKMLIRLNELVNEVYLSKIRETEMMFRQKEMELNALQAQINPHFLFNSLETIRGMALEYGMEDISDISASLAKLLRYNINNNSKTVTLAEEILQTKVYLRIQKYRFDEKLEYEFFIPEWAKNQTIAKFSIQPIVENSFKHGIELSGGISRISITALQESDDTYVIRIKDNGIGISQERLEEIRRNLRQKDVIDEGQGIGMVNVHRRIVHLFGDKYGISIHSSKGNGATLSIRLPMY
ncbi:sensor histidine kinase [Bacillus sp. OK048]|uniref:sensor histidine kinase n=1 Tax=Bacillus sp. OK048 TaxID=1882761 RepID=UPI00087F085F|nr:sensor histidine kinase [Bacillus sp. OK048]SDN64158.1 two-component system, sensor histidine kinase YesM [Bacillus sp. OK048]